MIGTSSTTNTTNEAVADHERLANLDLALHVLEYSLDLPHTQQFDRHGGRPGFTLGVQRHHADAWVESIAVDSHETRTIDNPRTAELFAVPHELHIVEGRLPVQGVRITIRYYAPVASRLQIAGA